MSKTKHLIVNAQSMDSTLLDGFNITGSPIPAPDAAKAIKAGREFKDKIHNPYAVEITKAINAPELKLEILPKHWEPKHEYVEICEAFGKEIYQEKIIRKDDVKEWIDKGWQITRLSKLSQSMVNKKWIHAIIELENE